MERGKVSETSATQTTSTQRHHPETCCVLKQKNGVFMGHATSSSPRLKIQFRKTELFLYATCTITSEPHEAQWYCLSLPITRVLHTVGVTVYKPSCKRLQARQWRENRFTTVVKRLNETSNRTEAIDFTNRMYFPVANPLPQPLSQLIIYFVLADDLCIIRGT